MTKITATVLDHNLNFYRHQEQTTIFDLNNLLKNSNCCKMQVSRSSRNDVIWANTDHQCRQPGWLEDVERAAAPPYQVDCGRLQYPDDVADCVRLRPGMSCAENRGCQSISGGAPGDCPSGAARFNHPRLGRGTCSSLRIGH